MPDSENTNEGSALDNAISQVMGTVEDSQEQPETATTDEGVEPTDLDTEEEVEVEDSDEEQPEADADTEDTDEDEDEDEEVDPEQYDTEAFEIDGEQLTRKDIRELKAKEKNLQAGYTKKYQKLAETQKQADERFEQADTTLQLLESQLRGPLSQYEQLNWQELQMQDPAKYQQTLKQFQAAQQGFNQVEQARKRLQDKLEQDRKALQQEKAREAVSTLQDWHSDWSTDLYHQVLDYAKDNGVPADEIESETRPWVISALLKQMRTEKAQQIKPEPKPQSVKRTIKQKTAKPRSEAQKRADALNRDRVLAKKGDRRAQARVNESAVDAAIAKILN